MMDDSEDNDSKNASLNLIADYGSDSDSDDTETQSNTGNEDSDAVEHHEMVLKNNIINACAHGPLSNNDNPRDDVEVTRHMIIDSMESGVVEYDVSEYRNFDSDSDSSSDPSISSDSDVDSVKDVEEVSSGDEMQNKAYTGKPEALRVHGELELEDLPPIEDLAISLPAQQTTKIGTIASIVDRLVIVRAVTEISPVDIDTVLFLDNGAKALGKVFDVFGPVTEPHYCVRFNSAEHVRARGVAPGADVYVAPMSHHTHYVFLSHLLKSKGSDASWLNDVEPPPSQVEYSDDEEERKANKARKAKQVEAEIGETSLNPILRKTLEARRMQRPSESSSRFGSGPSRGRNPFMAAFRRNPNTFPRFVRPWAAPPTAQPPPHTVIQPTMQPAIQSPIHPTIQPAIQPSIQQAIRPTMQTAIQPPIQSAIRPTIQTAIAPPIQSSIRPTIQQIQPNLRAPPPPSYGYGATPHPSSTPFNPSMLPNFCSAPPPFMGAQFQFGMNPRVPPPSLPTLTTLPPMNVPPPFRQHPPTFGVPYCNVPQPQWLTGAPPPPPPGT